jgi:threonine dehydratase
MCPVGGGGLLSGTAVAAKSLRPKIALIAVEPANADDAAQSFRAGRLIHTEKKFTIADGCGQTLARQRLRHSALRR